MKRRNLLTGLAASASTFQLTQAQAQAQAQSSSQPKPLLVLHRVAAAATVRAPLHTTDPRDHLRAVSPSSQIWSSGSLPAPMRVTWELKLQAIDAASCRLDCEVLVETDNAELVAWMARRPANYQNPVQAHCSVETPAFAAEMERKALQGIYAIRER